MSVRLRTSTSRGSSRTTRMRRNDCGCVARAGKRTSNACFGRRRSTRSLLIFAREISCDWGRVNIVHIVPALALRNGGPSVYVVGLSRALQQLGSTVTVYTTDASAPASAKDVDHQWDWELLP